jgi:MOSC domain-containing protein YiiM
MAEITSIVYTPKGVERHPEDHYARVPLTEANLIADFGIEGDRKGGNPKRNLNVMCEENLSELSAEGFDTTPGQMGEQIIIRGVNLSLLNSGDRIQLGNAVIEVINHRTGCERFEHIQEKPPAQAAKRLGVMARVVSGGAIRIGDAVAISEPTPENA